MMRFAVNALTALSVVCGGSAVAQNTSASAGAVYTVTHVDFMPNRTSSEVALNKYVAQERKDPGVQHVELLQSLDAPNHFTLLETFRDRDAYTRHIEAEYTRSFRAGIVEALGAPYDERLFREDSVK